MLSTRDLNRTLLLRQHLLERTTMPALEMVEHLIGLQAQENLPPYLSLAARIEGFDPLELSGALERGGRVRLLTMRGTIHVLMPDDALALRPWVQPALDQAERSNQMSRPARRRPGRRTGGGRRAAPRRRAAAGEASSASGSPAAFPGVPAGALAHTARERVPLVQVPPRGLWKRSGGVVYQTVENYLGRPTTEVDVRELVRRYLRAFGPATAADMTTWSRVTRLGPVFAGDGDELVAVECEDGRTRYDVPGAPYADGESLRRCGCSAATTTCGSRTPTATTSSRRDARARGPARNGGVGNTVFVDGFMAGLWWDRDGRVDLRMFRDLTRAERADLDVEVARTEAFLRGVGVAPLARVAV